MRRSFVLLLITLSPLANAKWVERTVIHDVASDDPKEIAGYLTIFVDTLNYLNADNLTASSRLIVKRFTGRVSFFSWENDRDCSVKDPSLIAQQRIYQTQSEFYYSQKPEEVFTFDYFNAPPDPCDRGGSVKKSYRRNIKARK